MTDQSGRAGQGDKLSRSEAFTYVSFVTQALVWPLVVIVWNLTVNQETIQRTRYTAEDGRAAIVEQVKFVTERLATNADSLSQRLEAVALKVGDDVGHIRRTLQDVEQRIRVVEREGAKLEAVESRVSSLERR